MNLKDQEFALSLINFKRIPFDKYDTNFKFIVNGKRYVTSRIVADLLSPIIRKFHFQDSTTDEFIINTQQRKNLKSDNKTDYFDEFLSLCQFDPQQIDETRRNYYKEYFLQLGNISEYLRLADIKNSEMTPENVLEQLLIVSYYVDQGKTQDFFDSEQVNEMIKYSSEHFDELPKEKLTKLNATIIESIINVPTLKIEEEDNLFNFILELYSKDHQYSSLFEHVIFQNLSEKALSEFIDHFNIEFMNTSLWKNICKCLLPSKKPKINKERYTKQAKLSFEIEGIMKYLNQNSSGNIHDNGTINITSNSILSGSYNPKNLVDYNNNNNNWYASENKKDAEVVFDFKDMLIQVSSYSIKSIHSGPNMNHLRNWVIEISNDGNEWEEIDKRENESSLNGSNFIKTFAVQHIKSFCRFVKLRQTGKNWFNNYTTNINTIDFNGKFKNK